VASHDGIEWFTLAHYPKGTQTIKGFYPSFLIYLNLHVAAQIKFRQPLLFNPVKGLLSQDQFNVCMHKTRHRLKQVHRRKVKVRESHKTSSFQLFTGAQFSSVSQLHLTAPSTAPSNMKTLALSRRHFTYQTYTRHTADISSV
jgi:hypothetical protein